jgi:type IX secretion system PorP/SprF family membrane protein
MRVPIRIMIFFCFFSAKAQVATFTQYNGALASINPAYISASDRNQFSTICRQQWPGNKLQCTMGQFSINGFSKRMNSGFGISSSYTSFNQQHSAISTASFLYSYRVLFMNNLFIHAGFGASLRNMNMDITNFYFLYDPKRNYVNAPVTLIQTNAITLSGGLIVQERYGKYYAGMSLRDREIHTFVKGYDAMILKKNPTFSVQGMYNHILTRKLNLVLTGFYEILGQVKTINNGTETILQPTTHVAALQANTYNPDIGIIGVSYKYFFGNYGSIGFRYARLFGKEKRLTIGYCYEPQMYIQYDKIRFAHSNEIYLKFKLTNLY